MTQILFFYYRLSEISRIWLYGISSLCVNVFRVCRKLESFCWNIIYLSIKFYVAYILVLIIQVVVF